MLKVSCFILCNSVLLFFSTSNSITRNISGLIYNVQVFKTCYVHKKNITAKDINCHTFDYLGLPVQIYLYKKLVLRCLIIFTVSLSKLSKLQEKKKKTNQVS